MKRALVLFSLIAALVAFDRNAARGADDPRAAQLTFDSWAKSCIAQTCFVATGARGACNPSGGVLSITTSDGRNASLSAYFFTKYPLEGTISIQIDRRDPILIPQLKCYGLSCGGKVDIDNEVIEQLRNSRTVTIEATTTAHRTLSLALPLTGFAGAYDGPGVEPKVREEVISSEKMKEMTRQAEEQKQARECQD
jgi:invasion protein IalB